MKKTYYHAVTMDKIKSIMQSGLIKNISDNGVYFTDDAVSSLNWIKCREELWFKREHKSLGLVIFEIDTDDEFILKAPERNQSVSQPISAPVDAPKEIPNEEQVEFRAPDEIPLNDLIELPIDKSPEPDQPDKKIINNVKPEDPLKDLYD